jgi:hypothetical protein
VIAILATISSFFGLVSLLAILGGSPTQGLLIGQRMIFTPGAITMLLLGCTMAVLYRWSRRAPLAAVISAFTVYASLVTGDIVLQGLTAQSWFSLAMRISVMAIMVRGLRAGLLARAQELALALTTCLECGAETMLARFCGSCGSALRAAPRHEQQAPPRLGMLLALFSATLVSALVERALLDEALLEEVPGWFSTESLSLLSRARSCSPSAHSVGTCDGNSRRCSDPGR